MTRRLLHLLIVGAMVLAGSLLAGAALGAERHGHRGEPASAQQDTVSLVVKITGKNFAPGAQI